MKKFFSIPATILIVILTALFTFVLSASFVGKAYREQYRLDVTTGGSSVSGGSSVTGTASKTALTEIVDTLSEIDSHVAKDYIGKIDKKNVKDYAISGYLLGIGDKYAHYMDKEEFAESQSGNEGHMVGIGINVIYDNTQGGIYVINATKNGPAEKAGVMPGDIITKVDGKSIVEMGYYKTVQYIKSGKEGDKLDLTLFTSPDYKTEKTVTVSREKIDFKTVQSYVMKDQIGMIKISEFNLSTPKEFKAAVKSLQSQGVKKFIFDVRNNPGGDLQGIRAVLDELLPEGPIIRIDAKNTKEKVLYSDADELKAPMTVLINGNTASAAELFSSALRDYKKATLIGTKTYGKGTMQTVIPLEDDGGALSISTAMYNPPYGDNYEGVGVSPNIEVTLPDDLAERFYKLTDDEDPQVVKAVEVLNNEAA